MRRTAFVFFICVATCLGGLSTKAGTGKQASAGSSSSNSAKPAASASATAKKTSAAHKKRRTSTKFVPKQKVPTADRISEIQAALARGGYYHGDPNGKWDSSSIAAMQKFQSANGLDSTGKLDAPSLQKLGLGSDIAGVSAPKPRIPTTTAPANVAPSSSAPAASNSGTATTTPATAAMNSSSGALASKSSQQ
jgi:hypothetical protein